MAFVNDGWMAPVKDAIASRYSFLEPITEEVDAGFQLGICIQFGEWRRAFRVKEGDDLDAKFSGFRDAVIKASNGEYAGATPERTAFLKAQLETWANSSPERKAWLTC